MQTVFDTASELPVSCESAQHPAAEEIAVLTRNAQKNMVTIWS